ncbi:MAG: GyrI-like domain-containing protein [bacterium]
MKHVRLAVAVLLVAVLAVAAASQAQTKDEGIAKVLIKKTEPRTVAVWKHKGPYTDMAAVVTKLTGELDKGGHAMAGPVMCMFLTNIETTPAQDLLWQVMIPVVNPGVFGKVEPDKMGFQYSDAMSVAFTFHVGPYETLNESYKTLFDWAKRNQYKVQGFPIEVYWNDPNRTPKEKLVTEIWMPVEEKRVPGIVR